MAARLGRELVKLPPPTTVSDDFTVHAMHVMKQLGLCIASGSFGDARSLEKVSAVAAVCNYIQLATPLSAANSISPNQHKKLIAAYMAIDPGAFAGTPFHLQMHSDLSASLATLKRMIPEHCL